MLSGNKILITGAAGSVASPITESLARDNEVWALARFGNPADRARLEALGVRSCSADLGSGELSGVPDDFHYVLHFAFARVPQGPGQFDQAFRTNGEGTGFLLQHCRKARAALVVSSAAVYSPHDDPYHAHDEDGLLGRAWATWSPSSPVSKIAEEAVARFCARAFDLPTTIVRLNTVYGRAGHLPSLHIRAMQAGQNVPLPFDPNPHSPIHVDDLCAQVEALLGSAGVPPLVTNWAGDEVITAQHWCTSAAQQLGVEARLIVNEVPGAPRGNVADITRRRSITGPCTVRFDDGLRRLLQTFHGAG
ncbi:NAD-dependent epimerase/dehydratase family protein [Solimonas soli]|uniref:NAD-dependent epimerase/dehydratase family protein n=1 Tax=Solimonas soli TaxID=413479 RepID=UPI000486DBAE|nr:NAD(P)-dependent oxidoreductase [Solimonas soli]